MVLTRLPVATESYSYRDAIERDPVTARRAKLARVLLRERYLTRESLILRVESQMGYACFGKKSWVDNFYRDMRVVKAALKRSGFEVKFSRSKDRSGYYFAGEEALHAEVRAGIAGALLEIDPRQIDIAMRLSPAQKFSQACSITDLARRVAGQRGQHGG